MANTPTRKASPTKVRMSSLAEPPRERSSRIRCRAVRHLGSSTRQSEGCVTRPGLPRCSHRPAPPPSGARSEEHTSELQSRGHLVCRLLPEKKNEPDDIDIDVDA